MIGKILTGTDLGGKPVTGEILDRVEMPQNISFGSPLQGGQSMIIPFTAYLLREHNTFRITCVSPAGITSITDKPELVHT